MTEELRMEGTDASDQLKQTSEPLKSPHLAAADNPTDARTDGSRYNLNDSGHSTPTHGNPFAQPTESNHGNVFQPYAIEEPGDEPESAVQKRELPCLPDYFERWQRELVDYMDDLGYQSNKTANLKLHQSQRRGQKRKSTNPTSGGSMHSSQSHRSKSKTGIIETPLHVPGLSPKRRRRRSKLPGDTAKGISPVTLHDFREERSDGSLSSDLRSTGASSAESTNESAVADEMDID